MPRLEIFVRLREDNDLVSFSDDVSLEFEGYDLVDLVSTYIAELLFRRACKTDV